MTAGVRNYRSKAAGTPPRASSPAVSRWARANRGSGTRPEVVLSGLLRRKLLLSQLPGRPDFVYRKAGLAVFVHGCWWHRCPICNIALPKVHKSYWRRKLDRNVERDELNKKELESAGWKILEVWEHEVRHNPAQVALRIKASAHVNSPLEKI